MFNKLNRLTKNQLTNYQKAILAIFVASFFWSSAVIVLKKALITTPPLTFTFFRITIGLLVFLPTIIKNFKELKIAVKKIAPIALLGSFNIGLFAVAIKITSVDVSQMIYAGVPLLIILFSTLLFKDKFPNYKIWGAILGFSGIIFIMLLQIFAKGQQITGSSTLGNLLIAVGVLAWTFYNLLSEKKLKAYKPEYITITFFLTSVIIFFFLAIFEYISYPNWSIVNIINNIPSIIYVGVFGTSLTYFLYQYTITHASSFIASLNQYLQPTLTFILAYFFLGEQLTPLFIIGSLVVFAGLFIATDMRNKILRIRG